MELESGQLLTSGSVYRRVPAQRDYWLPDGSGPSHLAFRLNDRDRATNTGLSVHLVHMTSPDEVLQGKPTAGLVELSIEEIIREGFAVRYKPLDDQPGHSEIEGDFSPPNREKLRRIAKLIKKADLG